MLDFFLRFNYNIIMINKKTDLIKQNLAKENGQNSSSKANVSQDNTKLSYKVFGKDITLSDSDIIDYYKTRMKIMVMRFMLVGRIDDKGSYKIKDEIKYDLIRMNKEISDSGEDYYRAESRYISKIFYFYIKIENLDGNKAKASLYLSEFVDDFLEDEYIESHIADFVDNYDEQFRVKVRQAFNLHDTAIKNDEFKMPALAVLMQDEFDINEYIGGLYDIASQIYVMRMLKLLEASGDETCLKIIKRYKELSVDKDENDINEKYKFTKFKALLDRAIDENGGLEKLKVNKDELKSIVNEVNKSVKAIDGVQKRAAAVEVLKNKGDAPAGGGKTGGSKKKGSAKSVGNNGKATTAKAGTKKTSTSTSSDKKKEDDKKNSKVQGDPGTVASAYDAGQKILDEWKKSVDAAKNILDVGQQILEDLDNSNSIEQEITENNRPQEQTQELPQDLDIENIEDNEEDDLSDASFAEMEIFDENSANIEDLEVDNSDIETSNNNTDIEQDNNKNGAEKNNGSKVSDTLEVTIELESEDIEKDIEGEINIELENENE